MTSQVFAVGAVAAGISGSGVMAYSINKAERSEAIRRSLELCTRRGVDCSIKFVFAQKCIAVAYQVDGHGYGVQTNNDLSIAQNEALAGCRAYGRECRITSAQCDVVAETQPVTTSTAAPEVQQLAPAPSTESAPAPVEQATPAENTPALASPNVEPAPHPEIAASAPAASAIQAPIQKTTSTASIKPKTKDKTGGEDTRAENYGAITVALFIAVASALVIWRGLTKSIASRRRKPNARRIELTSTKDIVRESLRLALFGIIAIGLLALVLNAVFTGNQSILVRIIDPHRW
jgi:hypothetical protein